MSNIETVKGKFVHIVATVNFDKGTGRILYVNPASVGLYGKEGDKDVELIIYDLQKNELARIHPVLRFPVCEGAVSKTAMIQQDVPFIQGMNSIFLLLHGKMISGFHANSVLDDVNLPRSSLSMKSSKGLMKGPKLVIESRDNVMNSPGVSYSVQVRPAGGQQWNTISVGRDQPNIEVDTSQFPGAKSAIVRVLRTNGFIEDIVGEEEIIFSSNDENM